jgi:transcription antitermination protein NusB
VASRRKSRQQALQILFLWDMRKQSAQEAIQAYIDTQSPEEKRVPRDPFVGQIVEGVAADAAAIDERIVRNAEHWKIERMSVVDRNVLRLAVYEMLHTESPPAVVIDEALELARRFSTEDSVQFVNGVLDAIRRELAQGTAAV